MRAYALPAGELVSSKPEPRDYNRVLGDAIRWVAFGVLFFVACHMVPAIRESISGFGVLGVWCAAGVMILVGIAQGIVRSLWRYRIGQSVYTFEELIPQVDLSEEALTQINEVKEEYGRLLSDLAYRVEFSALFDAASPATEELTLALFDWDSTWAQLDGQGRAKLAGRVGKAFQEAKAYAERVGLQHLPRSAHDKASRALRAARVAADRRAAKGERDAALRVAVEILDDLALYYLPTGAQANEALQGRRLKQLPGRRSS